MMIFYSQTQILSKGSEDDKRFYIGDGRAHGKRVHSVGPLVSKEQESDYTLTFLSFEHLFCYVGCKCGWNFVKSRDCMLIQETEYSKNN